MTGAKGNAKLFHGKEAGSEEWIILFFDAVTINGAEDDRTDVARWVSSSRVKDIGENSQANGFQERWWVVQEIACEAASGCLLHMAVLRDAMTAKFGNKVPPVFPPDVSIRDEPEVFLVSHPAEMISYSFRLRGNGRTFRLQRPATSIKATACRNKDDLPVCLVYRSSWLLFSQRGP